MHEQKNQALASVAEWLQFLKNNPDIESLDTCVIDFNANMSGKRLPIADAKKLFEDGVQFSSCALIADSRGLGQGALGLGKTDGDPDGTARPLTGTICRVPWAQTPTAQVLCKMTDVADGASMWHDPRVILSRVLAQCSAVGLRPVVACELEFYLTDPRRDENHRLQPAALPGRSHARRPANLSLDAVEEAAEFLDAVNRAASAQGLPVCGSVAEYGIGQYEVNLHHVDDPLLAADQAVLLKRLVKGVARSLGMDATFMAKPYVAQPGSGLHIHASIVDADGHNRFGGPGGNALLEQAVAGMQALMYDSMGFFAPNFNSQRRYLGSFVPTSLDWAHNNRSVAFRVPVSNDSGRRIEHRVAGADASPHLTMAAVLAGILHGITHQLKPSKPLDGKSTKGTDRKFPGDLLIALERLERSTLLKKYFPEKYLHVYAHVKRGEYHELIEDVLIREYDFYA